MWPLIKFLPEKTNFKYVAFAPFLGAISALACLASIYLTIFPLTPPCGGLNCGVDFKGGSMIEISTAPREVNHQALSDLGDIGLGEVQVQASLIRLPQWCATKRRTASIATKRSK